MTKIKIKCRTHTRYDEDYNKYTETEFWYDNYHLTSLKNFKNGESVIMTSIHSYHDINGSSHDLHLGTFDEIVKKFDYLPKSDIYSGDTSIGESFKITKISNYLVNIEKI
ncbi:hypothetical protein KA005_16775 [bacterium]|nr:hypothetical protein [bacterium]